VLGTWRGLLGQNVIELADLDAVCETIALTVGLGEEAIDLDEGLADLQDVGSTAGSTVGRALAGIGAYHGGSPGRRARAVGPGPARRALPAPHAAGTAEPSGTRGPGGTGAGSDSRTRSGADDLDLPPGTVLL
jgi:hypothetical protein